MDKQKQIEELVFDLIKATSTFGVKDLTEPFDYKKVATDLYKLWGWRKITENAVVLTMEEYDELQKGVKTHNYTAMFDAQDAYRWEQGYFQGCKKTAERFAERLKQPPYKDFTEEWVADEICKELTENDDDG